MRSPVYSNSLAAVGTSTWGTTVYPNAVVGHYAFPLDYIQLAFGVTFGAILSQDANAITWTLYMTFDDFSPDSKVDCSLSQTTTTITVTDPNLQTKGGVAVGDVVHLYSPAANVSGPYVVATAPSTTTYTVTSGTSQSVAASGAKHQYWRLFATPAATTGATTRVSGPLAHSTTGPCTGIVLKISARTGGSMVGVVVQGAGPG